MALKAKRVTDKRVDVVMERVSAHVFYCSDVFCKQVDGEGKVDKL